MDLDYLNSLPLYSTGIVLTLQKQVYHKLEKLKQDISNVLEENSSLENQVSRLNTENYLVKSSITERTEEGEKLKEKLRDISADNKSLKIKLLDRDREIERLQLASRLLVKDMELQRIKHKLEMEQNVREALHNQQTNFLDKLAARDQQQSVPKI